MDRWSSYPSFAALFDDLLAANGVSLKEFARDLADYSRVKRSGHNVREFRVGEREPPYDFIEEVLATNLLHFDPQRIQPEQGDQPSGAQRIALFAAAGIVEVTPASVREWNREVLAGHSRFVEEQPDAPRPRWGDIMTKLLSFHLQGGRRTIRHVADEIRAYEPDNITLSAERITTVLRNSRAANDKERAALYRYVQLDDNQIETIESGISTGRIPLGDTHRTTPLTEALNSVLDKLATQGVSMNQLAKFSQTLSVPGSSAVRQPDLSAWRLGRSGLTLQKLRSLTATLRHFGPGRLRNPVTSEEIDCLVRASGFQVGQLTDTAHDIVAKIDDRTHITSLLQSIREAVDVATAVEDICALGAQRGYNVPAEALLKVWERPDNTYPTGRQVRGLLEWYNQLIAENGYQPLSQDEVSRVVEVAERDYARWQRKSHAEKIAERNSTSRRRPPSASFDAPERSR
jgi:hypothetical protein